ncbi:unnamed protein product, partial [Pylaiella littoralis]
HTHDRKCHLKKKTAQNQTRTSTQACRCLHGYETPRRRHVAVVVLTPCRSPPHCSTEFISLHPEWVPTPFLGQKLRAPARSASPAPSPLQELRYIPVAPAPARLQN